MNITANNPALLNLIGKKLHVRNINNPGRLNEKMYIVSVVFNADIPPEIGLTKDPENPCDVVYYCAHELLFSAPRTADEPLLTGLFNTNGSLVTLFTRPEAA